MISGAVCYLAVSYLKYWLKYDDALDVFGLHGVGGIVGCILTGIFANPAIGPVTGLLYGNPSQLSAQIISVAVVGLYTAVATFVLLMIIKYTIGLRVHPRVEAEGLDLALHGETVN